MSKVQKFAIFLTVVIFLLLGVQIYYLNNVKTETIVIETVKPIETKENVIETVSVEPVVAYSSTIEETSWDDILFLGDSLTVGLNAECDLESLGSTVNAEVGRGIQDCLESAKKHNGFKTVVITIGTNSFGMDNEEFKNVYEEIIKEVKENNPEGTLYINTIPPCEEQKARNTGYSITNNAIDEKNEIIRNLENVIILDLNEELKSKGYLTEDGIHLTDESYQIWFEFLRENLNIIE